MKRTSSKIFFLFMIACIVVMYVSCMHDPVIPDTPVISFSDQVQSIFVSNCATEGCHDGHERFSLQTYDEIRSKVKPGDAKGSELYKVITKLSGGEAMPPSGPLSDEQIILIYSWIMQGANNN